MKKKVKKQTLAEILVRKFGAKSESAREALAKKRELESIQRYYSGVLRGLRDHWFGENSASLFADVPFPEEIADHFGPLYQNLIPANLRRKLGEFYTPSWLAERLFQQCLRDGNLSGKPLRILDPACGSGVFLLAAAKTKAPGYRLNGFDLNPVAVEAASLNLLCANQNEARVVQFDSLFGERSHEEPKYDLILGNPPWNNWDRFSPHLHQRIRPLWEKYGLFNLSAKEARGGGAKKEFAALMLLVCADRYLRDKGRIAMVVPKSLFQTLQAGSGFRKFQLAPNQTPLRVVRVDDYSAFSVFSGVSTKTATVILEKGTKTVYPVPYFRWRDPDSCNAAHAAPIHAERSDSPWNIQDVSHHEKQAAKALPSAYQAYLGANTGGANGIFWLDILDRRDEGLVLVRNCPQLGKKPIPETVAEIEAELVYPLLRWKDVDRFKLTEPTLGILLPQDVTKRIGLDEELMERRFPKAYEYLRRFERELRDRAAYRKYLAHGPFYSLYNVGRQTLAPIKVVWRRMDSKLRAALCEPMEHPILGPRPIVPQETTVMIPCDTREEAAYLLEILNSPQIEEKILAFSPTGTKGFGSPGILNYLGIEKYSHPQSEREA